MYVDGNNNMLRFRLKENQKYIDLDCYVGNIDTSDDQGKEVILNITSNVFNKNKQFLTDTNGFNYLRRQSDYRETWD